MQENKNVFKINMLTSAYWKSTVNQSNKLTILSVTALMIALNIAISAYFIPVGENLRVYFSFIPTAIAGLIGGPAIALGYGFTCDILGFIIHPSGPFFPGYLLSSMLGALIYALYFYRARITVVKILLCKLTVNILINIGLNSLWSAMLFGKGYYYYLVKSIIKNILMLPIEVIILISIFQVILPLASKMKLIPSNKQNRIPII